MHPQMLRTWAPERHIDFIRIKGNQCRYDVGSGLNFRRKGLISLLERIHKGDKLSVVVAYRDRLARFGTELIETLLKRNGGELVVLNQRDLSSEEELTADLIAILTVFGARVYGLRRYREEIKEDTTLPGRRPKG